MANSDLISMLQQSGGISAIASQLGVSPEVAEQGATALLPAVVGGFSKHADNAGGGEGGLGSLIGMLGGLGGASLAGNVLSPEPTDVDKGNDVLGQIFGSKEVSRKVATHASGQTGIDPALLKKMLPILAMLVAGYMSHQASGAQGQQSGGGGMGGILGSVLGSVLDGGSSQSGGGMGGMLGGVLGSMLGAGQTRGGGNALDEILGGLTGR
ncbi:MAG: DUF937 domain-containing protein [Novosphingobium sp.]